MRTKLLHEKRLAIFMLLKGISGKKVAEKFGVAQNTMSQWQCTDDFKEIRDEMLEAIKDRFNIP